MNQFFKLLSCILLYTSFLLSSNQETLDELEHRLQKEEIKEHNTEIEGQGYMLGNWVKYREELEEIQKHNEEEKTLQEQIETLQEKKI